MIFAFLFLPFMAFSHVILDDVATTEKHSYTFQTVCKKMVPYESPLIDAISGTELDCMGRIVQVGEFCDREMAHDPYYIRGYVDKNLKQVVCHSGKKVLFKYQCVKQTDQGFCSPDAKNTCTRIKEKLAKRLDMVHSSLVKNEKGIKELNCFFESLPLKEKIRGL